MADKAALELVLSGPDTLALVTGSFALPCVGTSGSVITWASDNAAVLSADGTVARPAIGADNASVTLTATITKGGVTVTKRFTVTVAATSSDPTTAVAEDKASLVDAALKGNNADLSHVTSALSLPTTGPSGTTISWTSDNAAISSTGVVTQPVVGAANETVTLTATITLAGGTTVTKSFTVVVLPVSGSGGAGALTTSALIFADGATVTKAMGSGAYSNSVSGVGSGTITYSSGTTATATVDASTGAITLVAAGTTVITASKAATSTHSAVTNTYTLTVTLIASTLVFADGATVAKTMGSGAYTNAVSGVGSGTITYSSGTTATATVDASTGAITLVAGGTTVITASKAATGTHSAVTNTYTLTVVRVYAVGNTGPAGGKVFYINPNATTDGWTYLEAWTDDLLTTSAWKTAGTLTTGTGTAFGAGKENTVAMSGVSHPAAQAARSASYGGYTDWFIPSKDELIVMWTSPTYMYIGHMTMSDGQYYWSSSQDTAANAWGVGNWGSATPASLDKTSTRHIRVIRRF